MNLTRIEEYHLAYNNPGLAFFFNGKKFLFKKGLYELAQYINEEAAQDFGSGAREDDREQASALLVGTGYADEYV